MRQAAFARDLIQNLPGGWSQVFPFCFLVYFKHSHSITCSGLNRSARKVGWWASCYQGWLVGYYQVIKLLSSGGGKSAFLGGNDIEEDGTFVWAGGYFLYIFHFVFRFHIMRLVKRWKPGGKVDLDPSWIRWKNGVGPSDTTGKDCLTIQARFHCFRQSFAFLMPSILSSGEFWDSAPCSSGQMFVCQQSAKVSTTPEEIVPCEIFF